MDSSLLRVLFVCLVVGAMPAALTAQSTSPVIANLDPGGTLAISAGAGSELGGQIAAYFLCGDVETMIALLLVLTAVLSVASALAWLFVFPALSKGYTAKAGRSLFDPNLQSEVVRNLLSRTAVKELGVSKDQIAFARVCLIVGLIAQAAFVSLLVAYY